MKKPPPVAPSGGRRLEVTSSTSSLPPRPRLVDPLDRPDWPTSAEPDLGLGLDPDPGLDDHSGWDDLDFHLEGDAELRTLFAEMAERPGARTYLAGPNSTLEDGRYDRALEVLITLLAHAHIITVAARRQEQKRDPSLSPDRVVFITAADETVCQNVAKEIIDAYEEDVLPVHLLNLGSEELIPLEGLTFIPLECPLSRNCAYYVICDDDWELLEILAEAIAEVIARALRKTA